MSNNIYPEPRKPNRVARVDALDLRTQHELYKIIKTIAQRRNRMSVPSQL